MLHRTDEYWNVREKWASCRFSRNILERILTQVFGCHGREKEGIGYLSNEHARTKHRNQGNDNKTLFDRELLQMNWNLRAIQTAIRANSVQRKKIVFNRRKIIFTPFTLLSE